MFHRTQKCINSKRWRFISSRSGSNLAVINQVTVETDFKPFVHNNKLFVPSQFVGDLLGFTVTWNDETRQLFFIQELQCLIWK